MKSIKVIGALAFAACLHASPNRIESISVYGNHQLHASSILNETKLKTGIAITDSLLKAERLRLLKLDFLKKVEWIKKPGSAPSEQKLLLIVREKSRFIVIPWADWDDFFGLYADVSFKISNLRGRRDYIKTGASLGGFQEVYGSYHLPRWGGPLNLFAEGEVRWSNKEYRFPDHARFDQTMTTVHGIIGKNLNRIWKAGISGTAGNLRTDDPTVTKSGGCLDDWKGMGIFVVWDNRDWPVYPRSGAWGTIAWGERFYHGSSGILGVTAENRLYLPVKERNILAVQIKTEFLGDETPVYHRLHYGDSRTIRGIKKGSLSGTNGWFASLEYRFPVLYVRNPEAGLHFGWAGFFFADAGSAWDERADFKNNDVEFSGGVGAHGILDRWIIHGEIGYSGKDGGFVSMGTSAKFYTQPKAVFGF